MDLEECRREIDVLDRDLTKILERRMQVVAEVAAYKKEHHMENLISTRWILSMRVEMMLP